MRSDELGQSIRAWRDRLEPAEAGLSAGARRRAPGLRREELASLAGVSVDYLSRLEQGRATNPSPQVLAALARALRLSDEERAHLYLVAGQAPPGEGRIDRHLTPGVQRMLDRLEEMAVTVYDATWGLVAWNRLGAALLGDLEALDGRERNLLWREFRGSPPGRFRRDQEETERFRQELVSDLHAAVGEYPKDEELAALVADLRAGSEDFESYWARGEIAVRAASRKVITHPEVGPITVDCDVLRVQRSNLRMIVYSCAPGSEDAEKLALVGVVGLQEDGRMTIDAAPVIETERLRLERWDERHTPLLVRLASMPEVMRFIGTGDPWPPLLAEDVARAERRHWEQHGFGWRATVDKETGRGIGLVSLNYAGEGTAGLDPGEREIGWWLEPDAWGRGLGTEGSAALRDEAFDLLGMPSIIARIQPPNEGSRGVARKIGMELDFETTGRSGERLVVYRMDHP